MKNVEITVELPFSWCRLCKQLDLKTETFWAMYDDSFEKSHYCSNASVCEACEQARQAENHRQGGK